MPNTTPTPELSESPVSYTAAFVAQGAEQVRVAEFYDLDKIQAQKRPGAFLATTRAQSRALVGKLPDIIASAGVPTDAVAAAEMLDAAARASHRIPYAPLPEATVVYNQMPHR